MTTEQTPAIFPILTAWATQIDQSNATIRQVLDPLMLSPESPVYATICQLQAALTAAVAEVGDVDGWMEWHAAENAMGQRGLEACPGARYTLRKITTVADLARLISESNT